VRSSSACLVFSSRWSRPTSVRSRSSSAALAAGTTPKARSVLFHLSDRYRPEEWRAMLAEARAIFPATTFPEHWAGVVGAGGG